MSKFTYNRYPSIENSYQEKCIGFIEMMGLTTDKVMWSASEKIHGANVGAYCDGDEIQWASRSAFVNGSFYGLFNGLSDKIAPNLKQLANQIKNDISNVDYIIAYGELFGGAYPHPDVEKIQGVSKVQDRIWYSPDVEFGGFDIFCVTSDRENSFFIDDNLKVELFEQCGIFQSKPIFTGTLEQCLKLDNTFNSVIAEQLGYPPLDVNICEGLVIKPVEFKEFHSGSRVILKAKNLKFTEKVDRVKKERKPMKPEQLEAVEISECYITSNRLDNVLSKNGGVITQQLIGKFIGLFVQDAIEDLNKESDCLTSLDKSDRKPVTKNLQDLAKKMVLERVEYVV